MEDEVFERESIVEMAMVRDEDEVDDKENDEVFLFLGKEGPKNLLRWVLTLEDYF